MTFLVGLTGSIGMGKSTTAKMFSDLGCAVWDADEAVHKLYKFKGAAVEPVSRLFPSAIVDGAVSRKILKDILRVKPHKFLSLEKIVHPLVASDRAAFIKYNKDAIVVLDIPLLFEVGENRNVDLVVCVVTNKTTQKQRVLSRKDMTDNELSMILARQMSIEEKMKKSDFVIKTDSLEETKKQVSKVLKEIQMRQNNA